MPILEAFLFFSRIRIRIDLNNIMLAATSGPNWLAISLSDVSGGVLILLLGTERSYEPDT
jgi:hypothetical protein